MGAVVRTIYEYDPPLTVEEFERLPEGDGKQELVDGRVVEMSPPFSELGDRWAVASTLNQLGRLLCRGGDHAAARRLLNEGLSLWRDLGDPEGAAWCVEGLAAVSRGHGQLGRAARLWGAAEAVREAIGAPLPTSERPWYEYEVAEARTRLGEPVFAAA